MADTQQQVAIVGCGIIGKRHAATIAERPDAIVTALVDPDAAAREAVLAQLTEAGQPEPKQYDDLTAALSGSDISLVAICTPSGMHAEMAEQALKERKHVVVEKPIDVDLGRARRLGAAAARAAGQGVQLSVISDISTFTRNSLSGVQRTLFEAVRMPLLAGLPQAERGPPARS